MTWWQALLTGLGCGLVASLLNQYIGLRQVRRELERHEQDIVNIIAHERGLPKEAVQAMRDLARVFGL